MELLLNLIWLTLALPALWMWRREAAFAQARRAQVHRRFDRVCPFLLLGCVLVLLFPVVSATDDLHAMRQEMEESSPSKRMVKQAVGDKSPTGLCNANALPALISPASFCRNDEACGQVLVVSFLLPQKARFSKYASRAPPSSSLGEGVGFAA
jgi:hypothetical protein